MWLMRTGVGERRAIWAAFAGYGLDGFDFMVYTFVIPTLIALWGLSKAEAGYIASATLITSAVGGWGAGILADRFGRVRILQLTVLWFAVFTFLSGFTQSYGQLLFTRALQGFGFGGEWAVGSVLVAEIVEARHRGKAAGLVQSSWSFGWGAAALGFWAVSVLCPPDIGWRLLFWVGVLPGLLIVYIRRRVAEPAIYLELQARRAARTGDSLDIFRARLIGTTVLATLLSTGMMGAYYSVTTWLPTYLETERHLSVGDRTGYLLTMIVGSFVGYLTSAWLSDTLGRRRCFMLFAGCAALLVLAYTRMPVSGGMLLLGFPMGFFVFGIFSGMGACFAELFPSDVRCSGQGFCYSGGRAVGATCPALIGALSTRVSLGESIALFTVGAYAMVMLAAWALPETRGRALGAGAGAASGATPRAG
jgi:MFS family permease